AGMTGTAMTEADEFMDIYGLDVVEVPTNRPMIRADDDDEVYRTAAEKYRSILTLIDDCKSRGQPVLVGTTSIEKSENLAEQLRQRGWEQHDFSDPNAFAALYSGDEGAAKAKVFAILNARYHEQEAYIVAQAGVPGAITIATNMAGRGTDIQLGGNADMRVRQELVNVPEGPERDRRIAEIKEQVERLKQKALAAGGLYVLGTERHESRRIDNQLRGRSGRQGDPGHSKFFLSLEDDLMRIFGSDRLDGMLQRLGLKEDEAIVHSWINKAVEKAQQKVEARNFDIRKNLLKFDNVSNDQRKVIFDRRVELMRDENVAETVAEMRRDVIDDLVAKHIPEKAYPEQWDTAGLKEDLNRVLALDLPVDAWAKEEGIADEEIIARIERRADEHMAAKVAQWGPDVIRYVERSIVLQTLDHLWREQLVMLEHLRQVIGLRGYGQRDPLNEYKSEAFTLFESMTTNLREAVTSQLMRVEIVQSPPPPEATELPFMQAHHIDPSTGEDELAMSDARLVPALAGDNGSARAAAERNPKDPTSWGKVGRNEACPCGSGKKFKHCHGRYA
ncbi:MAG: SEC-C domain-containing protein, partial [Xanthobacteraceae bacterium]|nr:SEC-C domain-containing protein [Xanthobacteraceae bacterium]